MASSVSAEIVHDAAGPPAHALEAYGEREAGIDVDRGFSEVADRLVDVAAGDVVADFQDDEQDREEDRAGIDHACRQVVGSPPQQRSRDPE
jgi:hypothetical protein